jgi:hypothetical protein
LGREYSEVSGWAQPNFSFPNQSEQCGERLIPQPDRIAAEDCCTIHLRAQSQLADPAGYFTRVLRFENLWIDLQIRITLGVPSLDVGPSRNDRRERNPPMKAKLLLCISTLGMTSSLCCAANAFPPPQTSEELVPVSTVVTVEAKHGKDVPVINKEDVRVMQGHNRLQVVEWFPVQGEHAALELLILIDEAASPTVANQFDDLRKFMSAQPSTTAVAVGYSEYGSLRMAQDFTTDHEAAGKALRIPMGMFGGESSPYLAVSDAIKHWHDTKARRAILMVSDGVDPLQPGITDTYLDAAVEDAQRAGVQVSAIFVSAAGHFGHSFWRISRGQDDLSGIQHARFVLSLSGRVHRPAWPSIPAQVFDQAGEKAVLPACEAGDGSAERGTRRPRSGVRGGGKIAALVLVATSLLSVKLVGGALGRRAIR